jgi:hypothetical protein
MIIKEPVVNKYSVDTYEVATGKHLETIVEDTEDRIEAFLANRDARTQKVTVLASIKDFNPNLAARDREDDVQNDLFWSTYNFMD